MSVTITGLVQPAAHVNFYAVRRYDVGTGMEIALLYAEQGTPGVSSTLTLQTAALSVGVFAAQVTATIPFSTSSVYWSEAFPRTQYPILLFAAKGGGGGTSGILVQTADMSLAGLQNSDTNYFKAAVTNCGFLQILDASAPASLMLFVGESYTPNNAVPPLHEATADWQTLYPCDVPQYAASGPFGSYTNTSPFIFPTDVSFSTKPDCYNIAFSGRVTVLCNPGTTGGHNAYWFQAPIPTSYTAATSWTQAANARFIASATVTSAAHAVFACNSGATVMVIADEGDLTLYAVDAAFTARTPVHGGVGDAILETEYGAGMVFAYLENELVWFCNAFTNGFGSQAKNSIFRVINASNHTYTTSGLTGFNGDEMLVYAGTYGTTMYVATSNGTDVTLHSFDGTSWTVAEADIIGPTASPILDLVADIIVGESVLITAVLAASVVCYTYTYTP
jgi:hypothetical protein